MTITFSKNYERNKKIKEITEKINNKVEPENIYNQYNNLGILYSSDGKDDLAENYYKKAVDFADKHNIGDKNHSILLNNLGTLYKKIFNHSYKEDKGYDKYNKDEYALLAKEKFNQSLNIIDNDTAHYERGAINAINVDKDTSFDECEKISEDLNHYKNSYNTYIGKVTLYLNYLKNQNKDVDESIIDKISNDIFKKNMNLKTSDILNLLSFINEIDNFLQLSKVQIDTFESYNYYQYTSIRTLESIMGVQPYKEKYEGFSLRLYNASYMNDPYEGIAIKKQIEKDSKLVTSNMLDNILGEKYDNNVYMSSLSKINPIYDSGSMQLWNGYGDNHKGVALSIKISNDNSGETSNVENYYKLETSMYNVLYSDNDDANSIIKKISEFIGKLKPLLNINSEKYNENVRNEVKFLINKIRFLYKTKNYSYENEIRILKEVSDKDDTEYIAGDPRLFVSIDKNDPLSTDLTCVTFGVKCTKSYLWPPLINKKSSNEIKIEKSNINYR